MSEQRKEALRHSLAASRRELFELAQGLDEAQWEATVYSDTETWRASDLLRHLASAESGMTRLIEHIRAGGEGVPPDYDLARYNASRVRKALDRSPAELMAEMKVNREKLLGLLESISEEEMDLKGRHASLRIMTIEEIFELIGRHETQHSKDLRAALTNE